MKKGFIFGLVAILAIFSMVMVGCDNGSKGGGGTKGDDAELASTNAVVVTWEGATAPITLRASNMGNPAADWASVVAGALSLPSAAPAAITLTATPTDPKASVLYGKTSDTTAPTFTASGALEVADGDQIGIKVIAENGSTVLIYGLAVTKGRNTGITSISIDGKNVTDMPSAGTSVTAAEPKQFAMGTMFSNRDIDIVVVTEDAASTVKFAAKNGLEAPEAADWSAETSIVLEDGQSLYIEVTASNGTTKAYYRIVCNFDMFATIQFGTPPLVDGKPTSASVSAFANSELYYIVRPAPECTPEFAANPDTSGIGRALWDNDGLWLYVEVTDPNVDPDPATASHHETDSIELFIDEWWEGPRQGSYGTRGGQYRIGAQGEKSSDPGAAATPYNALPSVTWTTETGYAAIFQGPWRFKDTYPLADNKKIGFEIQINCCDNVGGQNRYGVIVWNNIVSQSYNNVSDYTSATLVLGDGQLRTEVKAPVITAQPAGKVYTPGEAMVPLTVTTATREAGVTESIEWFKAAQVTGAGTSVGVSETCTPDFTGVDEGTPIFYYAVVTHTMDSASEGYKTKSVTSARVQVVVFGGAIVDEVTVTNAAFPVFKFSLPTGATWADYTTASVQVKLPADMVDTAWRSRAYGDFAINKTQWSAQTGFMMWDYGGGNNNPYLLSNVAANAGYGGATLDVIATDLNTGDTVEADTWYTLSYNIDGTDKLGDYVEANLPSAVAATADVYLGLGLTTNGNAGSAVLTYFMQNVTLIHATDTTKNIKSTGAAFSGFCANGADNLERRVIFEGLTPDEWIISIPEGGLVNETAYTSSYSAGIVIEIPTTYDVRDYTKMVIGIEAYGVAGTDTVLDENTAANLTWGGVQLKFFATVAGSVNDSNIGGGGGQVYNIGAGGDPATISIPATVLASTDPILSIGFQTGNGNNTATNIPAFIKIKSVKFTDPE